MPTTRAAARKRETAKAGPSKETSEARQVEIKEPSKTKPTKSMKENIPDTPSNIIEKGIIYFLTRGRVNVVDPKGVKDLQRNYIILRPLPDDEKLGKGPIPDKAICRLILIPKKALPKSHRERFMAIVEKSNVSMNDLKATFFIGTENETKTKGTTKTPPVTPIGEGVYAITSTGRTSHLAYILAIPGEVGKKQKDIGIRDKGSFIISLKNPAIKGPAYAQLSGKPDFPKSVLEEFRGLRWMSIQKPEHLECPNSQLLLVGEGQDTFKGAFGGSENDVNAGSRDREVELEELDEEEEARLEQLHGEDSIFDDLHIRKEEYPSLSSTW